MRNHLSINGMKHNVDGLWIDIFKQICLFKVRNKKQIHQCNKGKKSKLHASKTTHSLILGKKILDKVDLNNSKSRNAKIFE